MHKTSTNTWEPWMRAGDLMMLNLHADWACHFARIAKEFRAELACFYGQKA